MEGCVNITTNDGKTFQVLDQVTNYSTTLSDLLKETRDGNISIPSVDGKTLAFINEYYMWYKDQIPQGPVTKDLTEWELGFFVTKDSKTTLAIINATNYLDMKRLLDACCVSIAKHLQGKDNKGIYEFFEVEDPKLKEEEITELEKEIDGF